MTLYYPEVLLLLIPLGFLWVRYTRRKGATGLWRILIQLVFVFALAGPSINWESRGVDLWILVDRSASISKEARKEQDEFLNRIQNARPTNSRIGRIEFAGNSQLTRSPDSGDKIDASTNLNSNRTDLNGALKKAFGLVHPDRSSRILMLSDGLYTSRNPVPMGMWAHSHSIPIDYRDLSRPSLTDVAVTDVSLPDTVEPGEQFQFSVRVQSNINSQVRYRIKRGNQLLAEGEREVNPGQNKWIFRDILEESGIHPYRIELNRPGDKIQENNTGLGAVRVVSARKVLVIQSGRRTEDRFVSALRNSKIPTDVKTVSNAFGGMQDLDPYGLVVLENVSGSALGRRRMNILQHWVQDFGGGLLITGGMRSYARGGYLKSPLEPVLPVSMELKRQKRKMNSSVVIVMDRSGSMAAPAGSNMTKMDLANIASIEAVKALLPGDEISIITVDSNPHLIVPMQKIEKNRNKIMSSIKKIESMGSGIFVRNGLQAAISELGRSTGAVKHIILFADARDSEQQAGVISEVRKWNKSGITLSVVGLGTGKNRHAPFLRGVAKAGNGKVYFTNNVADLPRIFVQDIVQAVRKTFIQDRTQIQLTAGFKLMSSGIPTSPPPASGYNLTRPKKEASVGAIANVKEKDPILAFWNYGLGRAAAVTIEVDGKYSGPFLNWNNYRGFFASISRWLLGKSESASVLTRFTRSGSVGEVVVELDPERKQQIVGSEPEAHVMKPGKSEPDTYKLNWKGPDRLEATVPLEKPGIYLGAVNLGGNRVDTLPALGLSYSPEFNPVSSDTQWQQKGKTTLERLSRISGGTERINPENAFEKTDTATTNLSLIPLLAIIGLILVVLEIAWRRLRLGKWIHNIWSSSEPARLMKYLINSLFPSSLKNIFTRTSKEASPTAESTEATSEPTPDPETGDETDDEKKSEETKDEPEEDRGSIFDRAKRRARNRMDDQD